MCRKRCSTRQHAPVFVRKGDGDAKAKSKLREDESWCLLGVKGSKTNQNDLSPRLSRTSTLPILSVTHVGSNNSYFFPTLLPGQCMYVPALLSFILYTISGHFLFVEPHQHLDCHCLPRLLVFHMLEEPGNAMEGRARRRASPAGTRAKAIRVPPSSKRVPVVYYLCRNRHLEHPHFMEVPLSSPQAGLYLRDVTSRLDALRGRGMAAMYSWSCKRSYKNGFVWHDLSEDDLLLPAQGTEYVLKGSELLDHSPPPQDHQQNTSASNGKVQCPKPTQQESPRSRGSQSQQGSTSSSPSPPPAAVSVIKEAPPPQTHDTQPALPSSPSASTIGDDEQCICRTPPLSGSSGSSSPKTRTSSGASSPICLTAHDAATQTDEKARGLNSEDTTTRDNEDEALDIVKLQRGQDAASAQKGPEIVDGKPHSHPAAAAGDSRSHSRRSGTLESLIRAEASARMLEEHDKVSSSVSGSAKLKPANLLARFIACGSMSVGNHPGFGLMQNYRPQWTARLEFPSSPVLSPLGALKPTTTTSAAARASETQEHSSGSLHDTGKLKRSSSHKQDGVSEGECSKGDSVSLSRTASRRTSDPSSGRIPSSRVVSFLDEKEGAIKIEERLASGARVVIQYAP